MCVYIGNLHCCDEYSQSKVSCASLLYKVREQTITIYYCHCASILDHGQGNIYSTMDHGQGSIVHYSVGLARAYIDFPEVYQSRWVLVFVGDEHQNHSHHRHQQRRQVQGSVHLHTSSGYDDDDCHDDRVDIPGTTRHWAGLVSSRQRRRWQ